MGGWCHIDSSKVTVPFPGLSGIRGKLTSGLSSCLSVPWPPMSPCLCRLTPSLLVVPSRVLVAECCGHCLHPGGPRALHRGRRHRLLHYHKALLVVPLHGQRESEASQSAPAARVVGWGWGGGWHFPPWWGNNCCHPATHSCQLTLCLCPFLLLSKDHKPLLLGQAAPVLTCQEVSEEWAWRLQRWPCMSFFLCWPFPSLVPTGQTLFSPCLSPPFTLLQAWGIWAGLGDGTGSLHSSLNAVPKVTLWVTLSL